MSGRSALKPKPGSKEVFADDLREVIEFVKEIRPKVNSLHDTVITADNALVKKISTIWDDIYTDQGKIVKRIHTIEERYAKTYDRAEQVFTKVIGDGALEFKFEGLSKKFYHPQKGLENVANLVVNPTTGISALRKELDSLKKDVGGVREGQPVIGADGSSSSIDVSVLNRIDNIELQIQRIGEALTRHAEKMDGLESRVLHNTAKHMACEYSIMGVRYIEKENVRLSVKSFFKNVMKLQVHDRDLLKVYRVKAKTPYKRKINGEMVTLPPLVQIKVSPFLLSVLDSKSGDLKGKKDTKYGWYYKIRKNKPDAYVAANKRWEPLLDHLRTEGKQFFFQGTNLFIRDGTEVKKVAEDFDLPPLDVITQMDSEQERQLDNIIRFHGMENEDLKGSTYYSYAFPIRSKMDAKDAYLWTRARHMRATHISVRGRLKTGMGTCTEFGNDDGETQAELQINNALRKAKLGNTMVVVVRYYGGIHLNHLRLKMVFDAALAACNAMCSQSGIIDLSEYLMEDDTPEGDAAPPQPTTDGRKVVPNGSGNDDQEEEGVAREEKDDQSGDVQPPPAENGDDSNEATVPKTVDGVGDDSGLSDDLEDQALDPYAEDEDFEIPSAQRKRKNKKTKKKDNTKKSYAHAAEPKPIPSAENRLGAASPVSGRTRDKSAKRNLTLDFTLK